MTPYHHICDTHLYHILVENQEMKNRNEMFSTCSFLTEKENKKVEEQQVQEKLKLNFKQGMSSWIFNYLKQMLKLFVLLKLGNKVQMKLGETGRLCWHGDENVPHWLICLITAEQRRLLNVLKWTSWATRLKSAPVASKEKSLSRDVMHNSAK